MAFPAFGLFATWMFQLVKFESLIQLVKFEKSKEHRLVKELGYGSPIEDPSYSFSL